MMSDFALQRDRACEVGYSAANWGRLSSLGRRRVQLGGGLLFAVLLPALIRWPDAMLTAGDSLIYSLYGTAAAVAAGYYGTLKLTAFPGVRRTAYIVPSFATSYGILLTVFLFARIPYSRYQIFTSMAFAVVWFVSTTIVQRRLRQPRLAVVPGGGVDVILPIDTVRWTKLTVPADVPARCEGIVADLRAELGREWEAFLAQCALQGTPVYHVKQACESLTGRVQIEHLSENTFGSLLPSSIYRQLKRVIDTVGSILILPTLLPIMAVIAVLIRIDGPGPIFFTQPRMGYRGKVFTILKFRTMRTDADRGLHFTVNDDSRVTRIGRFLRRYRFDELPQIINILKGEMSWIGPRPEALSLSEWYEREIPFYCYRHIVRPGITGWAQVNQGYAAEVDSVTEKLHYDFFYIKQFSFWLDLLIAFQTIRTVLTGFGVR